MIDLKLSPCVLVFIKGNGLTSRVIMGVEGHECSHVAGAWFDRNRDAWMMCEMEAKGLIATPLDAWWAANKAETVAVFDPNLTNCQAIQYDDFISTKIDSHTDYNFGSLFGFLPGIKVWWRKLTWGKDYDFCSELFVQYFLNTGLLVGLAAERVSPQYLLWLCENSILSIRGTFLFRR
jgi:hypothetical protein